MCTLPPRQPSPSQLSRPAGKGPANQDPSHLDPTELFHSVQALRAENFRLQALVCHLLYQNEQLRCGGPAASL